MNTDNPNENLNEEQVKTNAERLNHWNDRLDENLESEDRGDLEADEKAREYSEENGSGDQSDENAG